MLKLPIYLDYNATTPCDPRVVEAMLPYFSGKFGNAASRNHPFGWEADEAVDLAREQVAGLIGAEPNEIVFTSGATESINLALKGVFETYAGKGNLPAGQAGHIITCATEHNAVLDTCRHIEKQGGEVTYLPVKPNGQIDLTRLEAAIKPSTILIAVMYANNETGTIMPVKEISNIARKKSVLLLSDAAQAAGKVPVNVQDDGIDLLAFSAHKMYGPKGVGALYIRRKNPRVKLSPQIQGGGHQKGMRSGTLNVPGIVGFGKACSICRDEMKNDAERTSAFRDKLEAALLQTGESYVNGDKEHRLPHVTNISFKHAEAEAMIMDFSKQIAVSSGSACTSASLEPSHVLKAMGLDDEMALSSLRFSVGRFTTEEEINYTIEQVIVTISKLRELNKVRL